MRWRKSCCPSGAGSVFSFDIKGNREQGKKFIEALKVFSHLANVGDCRSLVIHPASTTHFRMSDEALAGAGISQGTIRLSIGLEDAGRPDRRPQARPQGGRKRRGLTMYFQVNGAATYCYTGGKAFDAAKPTVVFIHGVLNDHSVWIAAKPLSGQPRLERAGGGPARPLPQRRRGARQRRRSRRLHRRAAGRRRRREAPRWWATAGAR
jgi:hypothetical protein